LGGIAIVFKRSRHAEEHCDEASNSPSGAKSIEMLIIFHICSQI